MFGSIEGEKGKPLQFEAAPVYEQSPWCLKVHVDLLIWECRLAAEDWRGKICLAELMSTDSWAGIGMRFREVESTVQPCSNCTTQDSRQQQATCTLWCSRCSQTVQLSQDIPSDPNLNFFPSIADATVSAVNLHEIRIHTLGLDFEIAKQRRQLFLMQIRSIWISFMVFAGCGHLRSLYLILPPYRGKGFTSVGRLQRSRTDALQPDFRQTLDFGLL